MNPVHGSQSDVVNQFPIDSVSQQVIHYPQMQRRKRRIAVFVVPAVLVCLLLFAGLYLWLIGLDQKGSTESPPNVSPSASDEPPSGIVSYEEIRSHPEATLYYPESKVFSLFGGPEERRPFQSNSSAFAGAILISKDSPEQIYQWYKDWMFSHGWQPHAFPRAGTQTSLQGYARGDRERFYVAMNDPESLAGTLGRQVPQDEGTVFEISYVIFPASR